MFLHKNNGIPEVHRDVVHSICTVWALKLSCRAESVMSCAYCEHKWREGEYIKTISHDNILQTAHMARHRHRTVYKS